MNQTIEQEIEQIEHLINNECEIFKAYKMINTSRFRSDPKFEILGNSLENYNDILFNKVTLNFYLKNVNKSSCYVNSLGYMYHNGLGVEKDYNKAFEFYTQVIRLGNSNAMNNLGYMYKNGEGVDKDYNKAFALYTKATQLGCSGAMTNLGYMYKNGEGVEKDYNKAFEFYTKAIQLSCSNAMNNLGYMYQHGEGVEKDYNKAIEFYTQATQLGNSGATLNLNTIPEDIKIQYKIYKELKDEIISLKEQIKKCAIINM